MKVIFLGQTTHFTSILLLSKYIIITDVILSKELNSAEKRVTIRLATQIVSGYARKKYIHIFVDKGGLC